jgi:hypothetical protein
MRITFRLLLAAAAISAPVLLTMPASANSPLSPTGTPYEEVAAARNASRAKAEKRLRPDAP